MSKSSTSPNRENTLPITVANTGFLLDRLGEDCHPLQFLRELTQNAIESIAKTPGKTGDIFWDADWQHYAATGCYKLCITDTGHGMTGEQLVDYINKLSSSSSEQSFTGNYGVGAKISAATRNHAGLVYLSWQQSKGSMIHLWRDPLSKRYGLRQFEIDGSYEYCAAVADEARPEKIKEHGTRVILLGMSEDADTMAAPSMAPSPSRWVTKYLNGRYFRFPAGVTVRAREGWLFPTDDKDSNVLRRITGQEEYLKEHSAASGTVKLNGALARWWILKNEKAISQNSGSHESSGHIAALYQNELYELQNGRSATAHLQNFGVTLGHKFVVIYIEPDESQKVTSNTARTYLSINNEPLPWVDWAAEFRGKMPKQISALVAASAAAAIDDDQGKSIRERLEQILDVYKLSRYRPSPSGSVMIDGDTITREARLRTDDPREVVRHILQNRKPSGTGAGGAYSAYLKKDGVPGEVAPGEDVEHLFPKSLWVSTKTNTREPGQMEDRAASYVLETNSLLINADFRVFTDMIEYWNREYGKGTDISQIVTKAVRQWFQQALEETVIGVKTLQKAREWSEADITKALSEEALTAAVMQRYHVYNSVKRELGSKLGKIQAA
jgi:hypothetical protein